MLLFYYDIFFFLTLSRATGILLILIKLFWKYVLRVHKIRIIFNECTIYNVASWTYECIAVKGSLFSLDFMNLTLGIRGYFQIKIFVEKVSGPMRYRGNWIIEHCNKYCFIQHEFNQKVAVD